MGEEVARAKQYTATLERALSDADAKAERYAGYWRECSRHREQQAAEHAEAVAAHNVTLLSVRAELASARQELALLRGWQVITEGSHTCQVCRGRILRHHAAQPAPGMAGWFRHVLCATDPGTGPHRPTDSPPNPGAGPREEHP